MAEQRPRPGIGVDALGGQVVDPTENVRELVLAESKYQDAMRAASERHCEAMRMAGDTRIEDLARAEHRRQDEARAAEATRIDQLAALRLLYDTQASENLRVQVKTTSELISTQLDKVTTSLSTQITTLTTTLTNQINSQTGALSARIAEVERFKYESGGRTSVSDPATERALLSVETALKQLQGSQKKEEGKGMGQAQVIGWVIGAATVSAALAGILSAVLQRLH